MTWGALKGSDTTAATSGNSPSVTMSPTVDVALNDLIFVAAGQLTNLQMNAVSDNLGNTYLSAGTAGDAGSATIAGFYAIVDHPGTLTTVSVSGKSTSANDYAVVVCVYTGPFTVDKTVATANDNTSPFSCPATGTLALATELVIGYGAGSATTSFGALAATSPMNLDAQDAYAAAASVRTAVASKVVSSTTTTTPEFTATVSGTVNARWGTATFKFGATFVDSVTETAAPGEAPSAQVTFNLSAAETNAVAESSSCEKVFSGQGIVLEQQTLDVNEPTNWAGKTLRVRLEPSITMDVNPGRIGFSLEFGAGTNGTIAAAYIGHAASSGDAYDFDGNQVQVTFDGGSATKAVSGEATIESDHVAGFTYDHTKALIVAVAFTGTTITLKGFGA